jgi:hypothetical protein
MPLANQKDDDAPLRVGPLIVFVAVVLVLWLACRGALDAWKVTLPPA